MYSRFVTYTGPSMLPTFKPGDGLEVEPYGTRPIRAGDIVVFTRPTKPINVVHRVVRVAGRELITRGDNNDQYDSERLTAKDITGKVVAVRSNGRTRRVLGGPAGLFWARLLWVRSAMLRQARKHLRPPYRKIAQHAPLKRLSSRWLECKVVHFHSARGTKKLLLLGPSRRCIARQRSATEPWEIRFPYGLFIRAEDIDAIEQS